jgi:hypothetical protein
VPDASPTISESGILSISICPSPSDFATLMNQSKLSPSGSSITTLTCGIPTYTSIN